MEVKHCPKCGVPFECYTEDDCWCEAYQIHRREFIEITRQFDDCLCPACLKKYAEE